MDNAGNHEGTGRAVKIGIAAAALAGLLIAIGLIAYYGFTSVLQALAAAGWGIVAVAAYHIVPMIFSSLGWRSLLSKLWPRPAILFLWVRWIREGVNNLLPVAQVGGEVVGARLLTFHGARGVVAGAAAIADLTVEAITQFLFTVIGLVLLVQFGVDNAVLRWVLIGLAVAAPLLLGFVFAQRWGLFLLLERFLEKLAAKWQWLSLGELTGLHDTLHGIYRNRRALFTSGLCHLASWVLGAGEVWLALYFMGFPVTVVEALILESLVQAVRSAAFAVPMALGVQEGGYVLLGALFGISPEVALALSLIKRVCHLLLGLPALLAWHFSEGKRLMAGLNARGLGADKS